MPSGVFPTPIATIDVHCVRLVGWSFLDVKHPTTLSMRLGGLLTGLAVQVASLVLVVFRIVKDLHRSVETTIIALHGQPILDGPEWLRR